jgi:hypothetical protein
MEVIFSKEVMEIKDSNLETTSEESKSTSIFVEEKYARSGCKVEIPKFDKNLRIHEGGFSHLLDFNYDYKRNIKISYPIIGEEDEVMILENLLTKEECEMLMKTSTEEGFVGIEGFLFEIRNNAKRRTFDPVMSQTMFDRLYDLIPLKTIVIDECRWDLCKFMNYWRYLKYQHGQLFQPHFDGSKKFADEINENYEMSVYTLNIYLNDGFGGGGTRFFMNCKENPKVYDWDEAGPVTHVIKPKQGSALLFNHCNKGFLHDGETLNTENTEVKEKFLLRADLIYRCRKEDVPKLKKKMEENSCRFWNMKYAKEGLVEDYVRNTWKCPCVSTHYT